MGSEATHPPCLPVEPLGGSGVQADPHLTGATRTEQNQKDGMEQARGRSAPKRPTQGRRKKPALGRMAASYLLITWASGSLLHLQVHCHPSSQHGPSNAKGRVLTGQLWSCPAPCRLWASRLGDTHTQGLSSAAGGGLYPSRGPSLSRPISRHHAAQSSLWSVLPGSRAEAQGMTSAFVYRAG